MMKLEVISVDFNETVDYGSENWLRYLQEHGRASGLGYVGTVTIRSQDIDWDDEGDGDIIYVHIVVDPTLETDDCRVAFLPLAGIPTEITFGDTFSEFVENDCVKAVVYHELGHIVHGDSGSNNGRHIYAQEIAADMYAAANCGLESIMNALRVCRRIAHRYGCRESVQELTFRAADLGNEKAKEIIARKGWERKEWI